MGTVGVMCRETGSFFESMSRVYYIYTQNGYAPMAKNVCERYHNALEWFLGKSSNTNKGTHTLTLVVEAFHFFLHSVSPNSVRGVRGVEP